MGLFSFIKPLDINQGVKEFLNSKGSILLDVRTSEEYNEGHIEKSINIPLDNINEIVNIIKNKNTKIFVYCYSGGRSSTATNIIKNLGFTDVNNIGGIMSYQGKVVK